MIVELFVASLALFVWINAEPGTFRAIMYNVVLIASVSTVLFNGNPLLRYVITSYSIHYTKLYEHWPLMIRSSSMWMPPATAGSSI